MSGAYLLGHERDEWDRLEAQHRTWRAGLLETLVTAGLGPGARVAEVGCGSGALLEELAGIVGPTGQAVGLEQNPEAVAHCIRRLGHLPQVDIIQGDLCAGLPKGAFDMVVARWVFSFLAHPEDAVLTLAPALGPGGQMVVQDYMHDGFQLFPGGPAWDDTVAALRAAWADTGGDLRVAGSMPAAMLRAGLTVRHVTPEVQAGGPDSPVFRWVGRFLHSHMHRWVDSGHLRPDQADAFRDHWRRAAQSPGALLTSPMVVTVVGQRRAD